MTDREAYKIMMEVRKLPIAYTEEEQKGVRVLQR